ncbi:MAG: hypothetical protein ACTTJW_07990 [Sphaerochaeta sp.]
MPKKIVKLMVSAMLLLCLFAGCSTTIAVNTLVPAAVDISGYKTIAVRSTLDSTRWQYPSFWQSYVPVKSADYKYIEYLGLYSNLDFNASERITNAATDTIYKAINTGYFNVVNPTLTDAYVALGRSNGSVRAALLNNKVDAILTTDINNLYYDEYIVQEIDRGKKLTDELGIQYSPINFFLVQKYAISISYVLTDVENNVIIAADTFSSDMCEAKTKIGHIKNSKGDFEKDWNSISKASTLFINLIKKFAYDFRTELSPHYKTEYFSFMDNKPKIDSLKPAYKAVRAGDSRTALRLFADEYARSGHIASGYNAAILYFTLGDTKTAYSLTQELYSKYGLAEAVSLYNHMKAIDDRKAAAVAQINSEVKSGASPNSSELAGF